MKIDEFKVLLGGRIKEFLEKKELSEQELAEKIGFKKITLYRVLKGTNGISTDLILALKSEFPEMNWHWLITGNGKMENNGNIVVGANNTTSQQNTTSEASQSAEVLLERLRSKEKEIESLKEQLKLKDTIIELLQKK